MPKAQPLLLDLFPNASVAYSLRKLRTAYSGSAIRVRRSSDNTEQDIGFVGNNLDTASLLSFCGAGDGFVTAWYDQSGNARNATQATAGSQPRIVNGGVVDLQNSKPVLNFDGTDDNFNSIFSTLTQPNTIFSLATTSQVSTLRLLYDDDNGNDRNTLANENSTQTAAFAGSALTVNFSWVVNTQRLHSIIYNQSSSSIHRNSVLLGSGNVGVQGLSGFKIGSRFSNTNFWIGSCQEIIVYNSNQSTNRTAIETNINSHYNVY
jgi:hypothetical protein